jgi:NitT/TauT family transport system permease protein
MNGKPSQMLYPATAITIVAFVLLVYTGGPAVMGSSLAGAAGALALAGLISIWHARWQLLLTGIASHGGIFLLFNALPEIAGRAELGFWCLVVAAWLMAWAFVQSLWEIRTQPNAPRAVVTAAVVVIVLFWVLMLWEIVVRGLGSPDSLPPAPSEIWRGAPPVEESA